MPWKLFMLLLFAMLDLYDQYTDSQKKTPPCTTTSGKVKNKACKFPFIFKGVEHKKCTLKGTKGKGPEWCATSVDKHLNYVKKSWGNCNQESCKALPSNSRGVKIKFICIANSPFRFTILRKI